MIPLFPVSQICRSLAEINKLFVISGTTLLSELFLSFSSLLSEILVVGVEPGGIWYYFDCLLDEGSVLPDTVLGNTIVSHYGVPK